MKSKKFVVAGLVLAAITMVMLPLAGCKTEVDTSSPQQEEPKVTVEATAPVARRAITGSVSPRTTPRPPGHTSTPQKAMAAGGGCARPTTATRSARTTSSTMATPATTSMSTTRLWALFRLCQFHFSERFSYRKIDSHPCTSNNLLSSKEKRLELLLPALGTQLRAGGVMARPKSDLPPHSRLLTTGN